MWLMRAHRISKQMLHHIGTGSLGLLTTQVCSSSLKETGPLSLTVAGSDTIEDVKMKVAKVAGISAAEQQLI